MKALEHSYAPTNPSLSGTLIASASHHARSTEAAYRNDIRSTLSGEHFRCALGELETGQVVGPYRLVAPLGRGGQGDVWRARPCDDAGPDVALKIVSQRGKQGSRRVARLAREAERCGRLQHPSIVRTLRFGTTDRFAYLAMTLIEGRSLEDVIALRRGRSIAKRRASWMARLDDALYQRAAVRCLRQIASAVHTAHCAGVAHRDVKPANILVSEDRSSQWAILVDFGMGRDLDVATLEQLRDWSGSPTYMAPEKLQGRHDDEKRCDVYSLGATLFEVLTLKPFIEAPKGLTASKLWAYLLNAPHAATRPAIDDVLCPRLAKIVKKATANRAQDRYGSALRFAAALRAYLVETREEEGRRVRMRLG